MLENMLYKARATLNRFFPLATDRTPHWIFRFRVSDRNLNIIGMLWIICASLFFSLALWSMKYLWMVNVWVIKQTPEIDISIESYMCLLVFRIFCTWIIPNYRQNVELMYQLTQTQLPISCENPFLWKTFNRHGLFALISRKLAF